MTGYSTFVRAPCGCTVEISGKHEGVQSVASIYTAALNLALSLKQATEARYDEKTETAEAEHPNVWEAFGDG